MTEESRRPPFFLVLLAVGPLIAFLGFYWSYSVLMAWADRIGGLGFTMDEKYRSVVTSEGLTRPFFSTGTLLLVIYFTAAIQLFRHKYFGHFIAIVIYSIILAAIFIYAFMWLAIGALD
jgi:hypothetical protein